jgi:BolA protein
MAGSNHRRIQVHYADRIRAKLTEALAPVALEILDESQKHVGHFRVTVVSEQFAGRSRVDRQRLVYGLLAAELSERVHALALKTITPAEKG